MNAGETFLMTDSTLGQVEQRIISHEDICALRYQRIDEKLADLNEKFDDRFRDVKSEIRESIRTIRNTLYTILGVVGVGGGGIITTMKVEAFFGG